jgi:hypothetical protein
MAIAAKPAAFGSEQAEHSRHRRDLPWRVSQLLAEEIGVSGLEILHLTRAG